MSDVEKIKGQEYLYEDCQNLEQRLEEIKKDFKPFVDFCDYLQNNATTVQREINNTEVNVIDLYPVEAYSEFHFADINLDGVSTDEDSSEHYEANIN